MATAVDAVFVGKERQFNHRFLRLMRALRCSATLRNSGLEQRKTHILEGSRLHADQGSKFRVD
jgi:hypothetical protein